MEINILGCSGAKSVGKSPTSFLIDNKILIDGGSVVSKLESSFILENIKCVLLTHSHFDHIMELPFLLELFLQNGSGSLPVYASNESIESLYSNIFNYQCWPNLFEIAEKRNKNLNLLEYSNLNQFEFQDYIITPIKVNHTVTTHGFIIDNREVSFGFTGDTYATDLFWEQCNSKENLKAIIVDVSFPGNMPEDAEMTKHMSTKVLAQELDKLNSKEIKILVSHMKPNLTEEIKADLTNAGLDYDISFLEDGMSISI